MLVDHRVLQLHLMVRQGQTPLYLALLQRAVVAVAPNRTVYQVALVVAVAAGAALLTPGRQALLVKVTLVVMAQLGMVLVAAEAALVPLVKPPLAEQLVAMVEQALVHFLHGLLRPQLVLAEHMLAGAEGEFLLV